MKLRVSPALTFSLMYLLSSVIFVFGSILWMVVFLISLFTGSTISLAIADSSAEVDIIEVSFSSIADTLDIDTATINPINNDKIILLIFISFLHFN